MLQVAQSVVRSPTVDPGSRGRSRPVPYFHGDYKIISTVILLLQQTQEGLLSVPSDVLVNRLVKLAQEISVD